MKKSYFLMAAAATMFAACSQSDVLNEVQVQDEAQAIGFSTYANKATRAENSTAGTTTGLYSHHEIFKVWGYKNTYTEGFVFNGAEVTGDGTNWSYSDKKYWDMAATSYQFYAAAPANAAWSLIQVNGAVQDDDYFRLVNFALTGKSLTSTSLENSFKGSADVDLMIASPCKVERAKFGTANKVQLNFNHILSRLNVTVKKGTNIASETVKITSFKVGNLKKAGNFDESANLGGDYLTVGTTKRWETADYKYVIEGNKLDDVSTTSKYIFQALVIPQAAAWESVKRDGTSTEVAPYFTIEYTIGGEPFSATFNLSDAFGDNDGMALCEGYQNTLNLTIDAETIVFAADVYEWADKNGNDFDIK